MHTTLKRLTIAALFAAPVVADAQGITVFDFALPAGGAFFQLTATPPLRRGVTSTVRVTKNLIDLVPDFQIKIDHGATLGHITHARDNNNMGYIEMPVTVPASTGATTILTLDVGFTDHFKFAVTTRGEITNVSFSPNPTTLVGGTAFVATVTGIDLGSGAIKVSGCHTVTPLTSSSTTLSARLTRTSAGNCATSNGPFSVSVASTASGDPSTYSTSTKNSSFNFGPYLPPPPVGTVVCTSDPTLQAPTITSPQNGSTKVYGAGSSATEPVTITWAPFTANATTPPPNNDWDITPPTASFITVGSSRSPQPVLVHGTSYTTNLHVPGTYTVHLKAHNCGTAAPSTSVTFTLSF